MTYQRSEVEDQITALLHRFRAVDTGGASTCTAASTTVHTPTTGSAIRLKWVGISGVTASTVVTVKLGATTVYSWELPGAFAHSSLREGDTNASLVVELSPSGGPVYFNYELEEYVA